MSSIYDIMSSIDDTAVTPYDWLLKFLTDVGN